MSAKVVYATIQDHIGKNDRCWPGVRTLAREAGTTVPTIIAAIKCLEEAGLIVVDRQKPGKRNTYRLTETGKESLPVDAEEVVKKRYRSGKESLPEAVKNLEHNQTKTNNQTQRRARKKTEASGFDEFWQAFPKKVDKQAAKQAWDKLNPDDELQTQILTAIERQKGSKQWTKDGGQFIPYPATWLRRQRWQDDLGTPTDPAGHAGRAADDEFVARQLKRTAERKR